MLDNEVSLARNAHLPVNEVNTNLINNIVLKLRPTPLHDSRLLMDMHVHKCVYMCIYE